MSYPPSSRCVANEWRSAWGYTGVAAVDSRAQLIVHAQAFGTGQENALLPEVAEHVRSHFASLGKPDRFEHATVLGDSGYPAKPA